MIKKGELCDILKSNIFHLSEFVKHDGPSNPMNTHRHVLPTRPQLSSHCHHMKPSAFISESLFHCLHKRSSSPNWLLALIMNNKIGRIQVYLSPCCPSLCSMACLILSSINTSLIPEVKILSRKKIQIQSL